MDVEREIAASVTSSDACLTYQAEGVDARHFADPRCAKAYMAGMSYFRTHGRMSEAPSDEVMREEFPGWDELRGGCSGAAPSYLAKRIKGMYAKRSAESSLRDMLPMLQQDPVSAVLYIRDVFAGISEGCASASRCIEYGKDMDAYRAMAADRRAAAGAPYPFPEMQEWTGGIKPGELVVLVGPSGMGKSQLAVKTALEAVRQGWNVYFATLELDPLTITERMEYMEVNRDGLVVPVSDWVRGSRTPEYDLAIREAQDRIAAMPGKLVVDQPRVEDRTPSALVQACKLHGCTFLIVDQLQFVTKPRRDSMSEAVGMVMQEFKQLIMTPADNVKVSMLLLHQMNREGVKAQERGTGKIGSMADIAHSSWVEQLSDAVWGIGRNREEANLGVMNIASLKHRNFAGVGWQLYWDTDMSFQMGVMRDSDGRPVRLEEW